MKTLLIVITFMLQFEAHALSVSYTRNTHDVCEDSSVFPEIDPTLIKVHEELSRHAAEVEDMQRAFCKTKSPPSHERINLFLKSRFKGPLQTEEIFGVKLENESPEALRSFRDLTTRMNVLGMVKWPSEQVDIQQEFSINPACKKVLCAVEKIWGKDLGLKLLYLHQKYGFNGSELAFSHSDRFKPGEIDDVLMAMADLPEHVHPLGKNDRLNHYNFPGPDENVIADAVVRLFPLWFTLPPLKKQYTIFHEMSHIISAKLGKLDHSKEWIELSGWVQITTGWDPQWESSKGCFASNYARKNPAEDLAEAVSGYRYNPNDFKKRCPEKYAFIKDKVFKGREYTSEAACRSR